jgi:hypothetical protein
MVRIGGLGLDLGVDVEVVVGLEVEGMDEIWNLGRMSSLPPPAFGSGQSKCYNSS